jgi:hypothetical protein
MINRERAARVLAEARETVERVRATVDDPRSPAAVAEHLETLLDAGDRWRLEMGELAAERERAKAELAASRSASFDWSAFDERVMAMIEGERTLMAEAFGAQVGRLLDEEHEAVKKLITEEREATMATLRDQVRELKIECAKLRNESVELRRELALDRGRPVDLPALPRRVN